MGREVSSGKGSRARSFSFPGVFRLSGHFCSPGFFSKVEQGVFSTVSGLLFRPGPGEFSREFFVSREQGQSRASSS